MRKLHHYVLALTFLAASTILDMSNPPATAQAAWPSWEYSQPQKARAAGPQGSPLPATVLHYGKGRIEAVVRVRLKQGYRIPSLREVDGYASRPSCKTIGSIFWVSVNGSRPLRVAQVDCAQPYHYTMQVRRNQVELSWPLAVRTGLSKQGRTRGLMWRE